MPYYGENYGFETQNRASLQNEMFAKEEENTWLEELGIFLNKPQSMIAFALEGKNPFRGLSENKYLSEALGVEGVPGLAIDVAFDPLNFIGGVGLTNKIGKLSTIGRKLQRLGVSMDELPKVIAAFRQGGRADDAYKALKVSNETITGLGKRIGKYNEASITMKNIVGEASNVKNFEAYKLDVISGLRKELGAEAIENTTLYKNHLNASRKQFAKDAGTYFKQINNKTIPKLNKDAAKVGKKFDDVVISDELLRDSLDDIEEVSNIFQQTGKYPDGLSFAEKVQHGLAGVGLGLPLNKVGYKTLFPEAQGALFTRMETSLKKLSMEPVRIIPKAELEKMSSLQRLGHKIDRAREGISTVALRGFSPQDKLMYQYRKTMQLIESGRVSEADIDRVADAFGRLNSVSEMTIAEWLKDGGVADDYIIKHLEKIFTDQKSAELLTTLKGKELVGTSRFVEKLAERLNLGELGTVTRDGIQKTILEFAENPVTAENIRNLVNLDVAERVGLDQDLLRKVVDQILDPDFKRTIEVHRGLMSRIFEKESFIAKQMPKHVKDVLSSEGIENYVLHKLTKEAKDYMMQNPQNRAEMATAMLQMANSSWKKRKLSQFTGQIQDKIRDYYTKPTAERYANIIDDLGLGLRTDQSKILRKHFEDAMIQVEKKGLKDGEAAADVVNEVTSSIMRESGDGALLKELIKNGDMELMSALDSNTWWRAKMKGKKLEGIDLFETDMSALLDARMRKYKQTNGRYHYTQEMSEQLVDLGLAKRFTGEISEGYRKGKYGHLKDYEIKEDVVPMIEGMFNHLFKQGQAIAYAKETGALGAMQRLNTRMIKAWKRITTSPFPSFHVRNNFGNYFLMWEGGMPVSEIARRELGELGMSIKKDILTTGKIQRSSFTNRTFTTRTGKVISGDDMYDLLNASGVTSGFYKTELGDVVGGFGKNFKDGEILKATQTMSEAVEGSARSSMFMWAIEQGFDPDKAIKIVNKSLFDYANVPKAVAGLRDNLFPFATWYWYNTPRQLEMMIKRPHLLSGFTKLRHHTKQWALKDLAPYEGDYGRDRFVIYMPQNPLQYILGKSGQSHSDWSQVALEGWFPFLDLNKAGNPGGEMINLLAPQFAGLIELRMNKIPALGDKPVYKYEGEKVTKLGVSMDARLWHGINKAFRIAGVVDKANPFSVFGTYNKPGIFGNTRSSPYGENITTLQKLIGFGTGLRSYSVQPIWALTDRKIKLQSKKTRITSELRRMPADTTNRRRNLLMNELESITPELNDIKFKLQQLSQGQR